MPVTSISARTRTLRQFRFIDLPIQFDNTDLPFGMQPVASAGVIRLGGLSFNPMIRHEDGGQVLPCIRSLLPTRCLHSHIHAHTRTRTRTLIEV